MNKSLRIGLLGIIGLLLSFASFAQKKTPNSLLWKISKKDLKESSYLFGTIHVICEQDYFWTNTMQKALESTKQLCLEMNVSDPNLISEAGLMMVDLSGGTLRDYFSNEADYNLVARFIEDSLGQNIEIAQRMKPVALYMMYSIGLVKGPCKETVSYEMKLIENVAQRKNNIIGLETLADQMEVLENIPTDSIIQQMIRIAKGEKSDDKDMLALMSAYNSQDLTTLNKLVAKADSEGGLDGKLLIDNRNKKWIAPMGKMMQEKATFFAVGAGHVYGLLELLKADGYTVEPMK